MKKVRDTLPGPLPSGKLRKGEEVLSPVGPRRYLGKWLAAGRALYNAHRATRKGSADLLFRGDLSWGTKIERLKADLLTENTKEFYDPGTLHLAGLRRANCHCSPGCGHRVSEAASVPSVAARERKRAERRRARKGARR